MPFIITRLDNLESICIVRVQLKLYKKLLVSKQLYSNNNLCTHAVKFQPCPPSLSLIEHFYAQQKLDFVLITENPNDA